MAEVMDEIREILKSALVRGIIQATLLIVGMFMIFGQLAYQFFDFGVNPLNARVYTIIAVGIIAAGSSVTADNWPMIIQRFFIMFALTICALIFLGGGLILNDALGGTNYAGENIWIAFDAVGIGVDVALIVQSVPTIVAVGVLVFGIIMIFYAEDAGQYAQSILEMGIAIAFLIIWNYFWTM